MAKTAKQLDACVSRKAAELRRPSQRGSHIRIRVYTCQWSHGKQKVGLWRGRTKEVQS